MGDRVWRGATDFALVASSTPHDPSADANAKRWPGIAAISVIDVRAATACDISVRALASYRTTCTWRRAKPNEPPATTTLASGAHATDLRSSVSLPAGKGNESTRPVSHATMSGGLRGM